MDKHLFLCLPFVPNAFSYTLYLTSQSTLTYLGLGSVADVVQLPVCDDVVVHRDVRLAMDLLELCRAQPQSRMTSADLVTTLEDVRQLGSQLLTATQSSEVPAVTGRVQQSQLGVIARHPHTCI